MWVSEAWAKVANRMKYCTFHSCQYGGDRKKRTMLAYSHRAFAHINLKCPGVSSSHRRKRWGKIDKRFATAEETAYPFGLAMCIAHAFVIELCQAGMVPPPDMLSEVTQSSAQVLQSIRAATGSQPKAFVLPPIVPEFAATIQVSGPSRLLPSTALNSRLTADFTIPPYVASPIPIIPKYAKLVSLTTTFVHNGGVVTKVQVHRQLVPKWRPSYSVDRALPKWRASVLKCQVSCKLQVSK